MSKMTLEKLIAEGRRIQRPCNLLKPMGTGEPVAMWFEPDADDESITDWRRWITVRADALPDFKSGNLFFFSVYTKGSSSGLIDFVDRWPPRSGIPLYAHAASIMPPIDAVFALGSAEIGEWLAVNDWTRNRRYSSGFPDRALVQEYEKIWFAENPIFNGASEIFAVAGGWHLPGQDADWHELIPAKLMLTTLRDSEPWVEAFEMPDGEFKVFQRIT